MVENHGGGFGVSGCSCVVSLGLLWLVEGFVWMCGVVSIRTVGLSHVFSLCSRLLAARLLPFTVTKPVTIREMSIAVASCDTILVFGKFYGGRLLVSVCVP